MPTAPVLSLPSGPFSLDRVRLIGILNVTPDSFYDHGRYAAPNRAVARAVEMAEEGADLIDIGGEKAGPGQPVTVKEEMRRVIPVITALRRELTLPLSVDTFKPEVARAAVAAGAGIINSIGGFGDPNMRRVAAETGAAVVVMHIQGQPRVAHPRPVYGDVVADVRHFLEKRVAACLDDGIAADRIIIDPGPGFGKAGRHDLAILHGLRALTSGPYPVLLAVSRKKFIGEVLGTEVEERLAGSLAATVWGVREGVRLVRTHDVRATRLVCRMAEAVLDPAYEAIA